jgi:hypothetical protein
MSIQDIAPLLEMYWPMMLRVEEFFGLAACSGLGKYQISENFPVQYSVFQCNLNPFSMHFNDPVVRAQNMFQRSA